MRNTLLLLTTLFASSVFAQADLSIEPKQRYQCTQTYVENLNTVINLEKVDETEDTVSYEFITQIGVCKEGTFQATQLYGRKTLIELYDEEAIFPHRGIDLNYGLAGLDSIKVQVTFDKKKLFKLNEKNPEKNVTRRVFNLDISPGGFWSVHMYRWQATLQIGEQFEAMMTVKLIGRG